MKAGKAAAICCCFDIYILEVVVALSEFLTRSKRVIIRCKQVRQKSIRMCITLPSDEVTITRLYCFDSSAMKRTVILSLKNSSQIKKVARLSDIIFEK